MQPVNPNAKLPRIYGSDSGTIANSGSNRRANDHMLSDASYLRIKNLTLAYTFPKRWMNKIHVSNLRLFVSIENLATFTSLPSTCLRLSSTSTGRVPRGLGSLGSFAGFASFLHSVSA